MSAAEPAIPVLSDKAATAAPSVSHWLTRWLERLESAGEWLNPILVKECRQAMKSRHFVVTFSLLLICGWIWSTAGLILLGPSAYYGFAGPEMFYGYFLVLAFPLLVIVPFNAFRSLAAECEDRTFELVSITSLTPRQIVAGKLGSSVVQMMVYFSAIAPCLAFTYLLRGIDVILIVFILLYLFLASLGLATISLLLSTIAREKHWQTIISIGLMIGFLCTFNSACSLTFSSLEGQAVPIDSPDFWIANAVGLTAYVSYLVLFYFTAASQLTFSSDNRSTRLRVIMLVQFLLLAGWIVAIAAHAIGLRPISLREPTIAFMTLSALHWFVMGTFMVTEQPELSMRTKRRLPHSFLGRVFLTWFNPGPGTGYMFAVSNMVVATIIALATVLYFNNNTNFPPPITGIPPATIWHEPAAIVAVLSTCYVAFYLGVSKLIISLLRRRMTVSLILGLGVQILVLFGGIGIPVIVLDGISEWNNDYAESLSQVTNPVWIFTHLDDLGFAASFISDVPGRVLLALALIVFALNLPGVVHEVRHVRIAAPRRVAEDEAQSTAKASP